MQYSMLTKHAFKLLCDVCDYDIGSLNKVFHAFYYANKTFS